MNTKILAGLVLIFVGLRVTKWGIRLAEQGAA